MNIPFEPMALPFNLEYVDLNEIVSDIAVASTKLGEFNEMMEHSKIAYTYSVNHMIRIESLYSTKIEGTQTTIDAVYESDTEKDETKNPDIKEVLRYNEALSMASKEINDNPITIKLLKRIHEILLRGDVRKIHGLFRANSEHSKIELGIMYHRLQQMFLNGWVILKGISIMIISLKISCLQ